MPWLVRDGKVLATLEVATSVRDRTRGLLGRDGIDGAILLRPAKSVHTFRMRFPIDVAFCDRDLRVVKVTTLARNRATFPVVKAHAVIESEAGTMARWGVRVGDQLDIRGLDEPEAAATTSPVPASDRGPAGTRDGHDGQAPVADGGRPGAGADGGGGSGGDEPQVIDVRDEPPAAPGAPGASGAGRHAADVAPDADRGRG